MPEIEEGLVRLQICIKYLASDSFGARNNIRRGHGAHSADLCIQPDKGGHVRLAVLKRDAEGVGNPGDKIAFEALRGYLPEDSDVWKAEGFDRLGNEYFLGTAKDPVHIS